MKTLMSLIPLICALNIGGLLTSTSSFAKEASCLTSPIDDLVATVKTSKSPRLEARFAHVDERDWFKNELDLQVVRSVDSFWKENIYEEQIQNFLVMTYIKASYVHEKNPSLSTLESYYEAMRDILPNANEFGESTFGAGLVSDFLNITDSISQNRIGSDRLGIEFAPYANDSILNKISRLTDEELCGKDGRLVNNKKFIKLVRSKLTNEDKLTRSH